MTDRRRNALILVLVGALLAAAAVVLATKPTRLGLDLKGGVELVYQAKPTNTTQVTCESVDRAIDIMRQRVYALGVSAPERWISGSATPRASTRWRMMSIARSTESPVTCVVFVGLAW